VYKFLVKSRSFENNDRGAHDTSAELIINTAGYYKEDDIRKIAPMILDRPQGRADYLFCFIAQGPVDLEIGDKTISVNEGCFIIPPNTPHRYTNEKLQGAFELYWVHFTGSGAGELLHELFLDRQFTYQTGNIEEVSSSIQTLVRELTFKLPNHERVTISLFTYMLSLLSRRYQTMNQESQPAALDVRMQRALEHIELFFQNNITVKQLADMSHLSVSRFSALFKKTFDLFPLQYITRFRIKKSCELLRNTEDAVGQIAELSGFEDPLYFSRVFKKEMGISPTQYRSCINPDIFDVALKHK